MSRNKINRRNFLKAGGASALLGGMPLGLNTVGQAQDGGEKKFCFVIAAAGGASILDSFMAQSTGPTAFETLTQIPGSPLVAVPALENSIQGAIDLGNGYEQATFLNKHGADTLAMTNEVTSVNHIIAAKRDITGDNVNSGRTICEANAIAHGGSCILPNLGLGVGGYALHGDDDTIPAIARAEPITDPLMFAFATHGFKGIKGSLDDKDIAAARALRTQLESVSGFAKEFEASKIMDVYMKNRDSLVSQLEKGDSIGKLMLLDPATADLSAFGTSMTGDMQQVIAKFPNIAKDPYEAKMALSFLAAKNGMSNSFTISPNLAPLIEATGSPNTPIAFDWSHVDHRGAQNAMWSYVLKSVDALIDLLKETDIDGDPQKGKMWSKSMIYIATEFGRDKIADGGSGHHLNNGNVIISPMMQGNKVFGGVDTTTGFTYGFNAETGEPDQNSKMTEKDVYSAVAHGLGIAFDGRKDKPAMVKG